MTFEECCLECIKNEDLIKEFNRLSGCHLGKPRKPLDIAIDKACGYDPVREDLQKFTAFVYEYVWSGLNKCI